MKKIFLTIALLCLISVILSPGLVMAGGLVNCGDDGPSSCDLNALKGILDTIYKTLKKIAIPLATLAIMAGGIMMMISAGNPNLMSMGKITFWSGIIGLVLTLGAGAIINLVVGGAKVGGGGV